MRRSHQYRELTVLLLIGGTLFHLWFVASGRLDLAPDEAHYWEWSRRLDWSYYSKGPMVAYLIAASTRLGAHSELFVRLPAVLLALGSGFLVYAVGRQLFGSERVGFLSVVAVVGCPLFIVGSVLMTIDAPFVFFWALALFSFVRVRAGHRGHGWWLLLGVAVGCGFLSKYTMLLWFPCFVAYLLTSRTERTCVTTPGPYVALAVSCAVMLPVALWNAQHDWVSLRHVLGQAGLADHQITLSLRTFVEYLGSQFGVVSPLLFCAATGAMIRSGWLGLRRMKDEHLLLFAFSALPLGLFLLWSFTEKVEANWAAPGYLAAFVATGALWNDLLARASSRRRRLLAALILLVLLPGLGTSAVAHFPDLLALVGLDLPPRLDPTTRLEGWKELGTAVGSVRKSQQNETALLSDRYQIASELAFYVPGQPRVYNVNLGRRMNQYDIWGGLGELVGRDVLFVSDGDWEAPVPMRQACASIHKIRVVEVFRRRGHAIGAFSIFGCEQFRGLAAPTTAASY
jgi:hypothetical protein